jgi:hypothetical protein
MVPSLPVNRPRRGLEPGKKIKRLLPSIAIAFAFNRIGRGVLTSAVRTGRRGRC